MNLCQNLSNNASKNCKRPSVKAKVTWNNFKISYVRFEKNQHKKLVLSLLVPSKTFNRRFTRHSKT